MMACLAAVRVEKVVPFKFIVVEKAACDCPF